jgi:hypothetical protein
MKGMGEVERMNILYPTRRKCCVRDDSDDKERTMFIEDLLKANGNPQKSYEWNCHHCHIKKCMSRLFSVF